MKIANTHLEKTTEIVQRFTQGYLGLKGEVLESLTKGEAKAVDLTDVSTTDRVRLTRRVNGEWWLQTQNELYLTEAQANKYVGFLRVAYQLQKTLNTQH